MNQLIKGNTLADVPLKAQSNLEDLKIKLNMLLVEWNRPVVITSGFRSMQKHVDVYRTKALREKRPFSDLQVPMNSKHLFGQAADIADPKGDLYDWATKNIELLTKIGLWCEAGTKGWLHLQSVPPRSGSRFFKP